MQLVVSDAHAGLKKAIGQVLGCPWQRCSVHFLREALGHVRKDQQGMVAALLRAIFNAESGEQARGLVGDALERMEKPLPKVAALLEEAEDDVLAFYSFTYRAAHAFRGATLHGHVRREPVPRSFWRAFFKGAVRRETRGAPVARRSTPPAA